MDWIIVLGVVVAAEIGIIIWYLTGYPRIARAPYQEEWIKATPTSGSWDGLENTGQIEEVSIIKPGQVAIKTFGCDYPEIVNEDDIMIKNLPIALAGLPDTVFVHRGLMKDEVTKSMMNQVNQLKSFATMHEIQSQELNKKLRAVTKDAGEDLIQQAKVVGAVRKEGSSGGFSPFFGGSSYRRPYVSPSLTSSFGGGGGGED